MYSMVGVFDGRSDDDLVTLKRKALERPQRQSHHGP